MDPAGTMPQINASPKAYDVVVVGSGAGGDIAAHVVTLAAKLCMLEAGANYNTAKQSDMFKWNYDAPRRAAGTREKPFGYYDATLVGGSEVLGEPYAGNTGTIAFNNAASGTFMHYFGDGSVGPNPNPFVGEVMTLGSVQGGELQRNYSIEADTSSVPEPSAWLLSIAGLGVLAGIRFKR